MSVWGSKRPCPDCGTLVGYLHQDNQHPAVLRCPSCIDKARREVELHAEIWAKMIAGSFALSGGQFPEIDPALLNQAE